MRARAGEAARAGDTARASTRTRAGAQVRCMHAHTKHTQADVGQDRAGQSNTDRDWSVAAGRRGFTRAPGTESRARCRRAAARRQAAAQRHRQRARTPCAPACLQPRRPPASACTEPAARVAWRRGASAAHVLARPAQPPPPRNARRRWESDHDLAHPVTQAAKARTRCQQHGAGGRRSTHSSSAPGTRSKPLRKRKCDLPRKETIPHFPLVVFARAQEKGPEDLAASQERGKGEGRGQHTRRGHR